MTPDNALLSLTAAATALAMVLMLVALRRRASLRGEHDLQLAVASGQHIPPTLHPVIDPELCIGSFSCIKACPEGDIIGVVDGVAQLVEAAHCIGHSRCEVECPVGAIKLVFGTAQRGVDLPETDDAFQSSRPGVYVIGELGGMGLIKNALRQGVDVGRSLKRKLKTSEAQGALVDVVIVGGGPAGIAAAISCKEQGLVARVFEQDTLGGTVAQYPRGKVVMSEAVQLPFYGRFGRSMLSKEDLLAELNAVLRKAGVRIEEGHKVTRIDGALPLFQVTTSGGAVVQARAVVLATGLRGSPRRLGAEGEHLPKVTYRLTDPEQYHGQRVLVVGGGDSAVEAAIQLAEESTAKVTISYRQDSFSRCKQRNRDAIAALIADNRVRALFNTEVARIESDVVHLKTNAGDGKLKNDSVIVSVGGELPTAFLSSVGVSIRRYTGEEKESVASANDAAGNAPTSQTKKQVEQRTRRRLALSLTLLGVGILAMLWLVGSEYYWLPAEERLESPLHPWLRPAGLWGHGVGVIATLFMISNFIYAARKRWRFLKGASSIRTWLTFHMFVGIMSPLVIAFHAAFLMNNLLALWTWVALAVVVGTGVFGRFLFGFVPAQAGKLLQLSDVRARLMELEKHLGPQLDAATNGEVVRRLFAEANKVPQRRNILAVALDEPGVRSRLLRRIRATEPFFPDRRAFAAFRDGLLEMQRARLQMAFYGSLKRLFRSWLALHVVLALCMVVLISAHIGVSIHLGYRWMFSVAG